LGPQEGQFYVPFGIGFNKSDYVYVTDSRNHRIQLFTPDGSYVMQWGKEGSDNGNFSFPEGIVV